MSSRSQKLLRQYTAWPRGRAKASRILAFASYDPPQQYWAPTECLGQDKLKNSSAVQNCGLWEPERGVEVRQARRSAELIKKLFAQPIDSFKF